MDPLQKQLASREKSEAGHSYEVARVLEAARAGTSLVGGEKT
jgi:hypothetical protein